MKVNEISRDGSSSLPASGKSSAKGTIVRTIPRPDAETVRSLQKLGVATAHESQGQRNLMHSYMRPIYASPAIAGPCVTVLCPPGDNLMIHAAVEVCQPGDVLVVAVKSESIDGMFGDLLGMLCQKRGVVGLVIDSGVRDTAELTVMQFPVWAKAVCAQGTVKASAGSVNIPIVCAGVHVNPGDVAIADADGVTIVPREQAAAIVDKGFKRITMEENARGRFRSGELSLDFFGLRAKLRDVGVEYID